ncbi:MAG: response regulator [Deltaproteobacteria bacterium]|nr:response regulator [Deltaproteobacteria bacterium]
MVTKIETILVVDDEKNTCFGLKTLLGREGYRVECVHNGEEGLNFLKENSAQLIISDIRMPGMDGLSFISCLKEKHPDIRVIVMTAFGGLDSYIEAMRKGAVEYIMKPLKINELKVIIQRLESGSAA